MNSTQLRIMRTAALIANEAGEQVNGLVMARLAGLNVSERTELARRTMCDGSLSPEDAYKALEHYTVWPSDLKTVGYIYPRWDGATPSVTCEVGV